MRVLLLTHWAGTGAAGDPFVPRLPDAAPLAGWFDAAAVPDWDYVVRSGQPAAVEAVVVSGYAGPFAPAFVLWAEGADEELSPSGRMRSSVFFALRKRLGECGLEPIDMDVSVGKRAGGRTRKEVADALVSWLVVGRRRGNVCSSSSCGGDPCSNP